MQRNELDGYENRGDRIRTKVPQNRFGRMCEDVISWILFDGGPLVWMIVGAIWGLIPFFLGRYRYRSNLGQWALLCCTLSGLIGMSFLVMVGFTIAILLSERDSRPIRQPCAPRQYHAPVQGYASQAPARGGLELVCLSGPLKGQSYPIRQSGLMFGRDSDCAVRFSSEVGGISRHHCALRWQQGVPVLVDLGSAYGTFLGDGTRLPPNYPTTIGPGTRFYLASPAVLFQITAT